MRTCLNANLEVVVVIRLVKQAVLFPILLSLSAACAMTSEPFQRDADIIRLRHLKYYSEVLDEYHSKVGNYPFEGQETVPLYVHVAHEQQEKHTKPGPPYAHVVVPFSRFVQEVESKLGREIDELYDPQYAPDYKPNFYIYMVNQDTYFFAMHLHQSYGFAKQVGKHYYKAELSNNPTPQNRALDPELLFESQEYLEAVGQPVSKASFFKAREEKYLHFTKQSR